MWVSVVICTYDPDLFEDLTEAVGSVLDQTYGDVEVVVVVDGDDGLAERVREAYDGDERVTVRQNAENLGLSESRNRGIEAATGDVVAFMDDDAVADPAWIETLVETYESHDALAVGGRQTPIWIDGKPRFLPEEFYWLIGVTHRGFENGDGVQPVRNPFGSNMSFRREALEELGGFEPDIGRKGDRQLQGEETELCVRLTDAFGEPVLYDPSAEVGHKIFPHRTEPLWLLRRAFWQGYSKRAMAVLLPDAGGNESAFLQRLLVEATPRRLREFVRNPGTTPLLQLLALWLLTAAVGAGYLYAFRRWR